MYIHMCNVYVYVYTYTYIIYIHMCMYVYIYIYTHTVLWHGVFRPTEHIVAHAQATAFNHAKADPRHGASTGA